jgi:predicted RNA-binding protein
MCQAQLLIQGASGDEPFKEDVIRIRVEGEIVMPSRSFEDLMAACTGIKEVAVLKHTVTLTRQMRSLKCDRTYGC